MGYLEHVAEKGKDNVQKCPRCCPYAQTAQGEGTPAAVEMCVSHSPEDNVNNG